MPNRDDSAGGLVGDFQVRHFALNSLNQKGFCRLFFDAAFQHGRENFAVHFAAVFYICGTFGFGFFCLCRFGLNTPALGLNGGLLFGFGAVDCGLFVTLSLLCF